MYIDDFGTQKDILDFKSSIEAVTTWGSYLEMESIQNFSADFDSAIVANQLVPEINRDFGNVVISGQN